MRAATVLRLSTFWCTIAMLFPSPSSAAPTRETELKAAYIFKFASFVQWPTDAFARALDPFRFCVAGDVDVQKVLGRLAAGQQIGGHPALVENVDDHSEQALARCHILYAAPAGERLQVLLKATERPPVLTVTNTGEGLRRSVIRFVRRGANIRFVVNRQLAEAKRLSISSKMLAVAVEGYE